MAIFAACAAASLWWQQSPSGLQPQPRARRLSREDFGEDPTHALVGVDEVVTELRWFKGKLLHPVGRFFGGHHSSLVVIFESGKALKIEKLGLGTVSYCPNTEQQHCNLAPGELYKAAGGKFLKLVTWRDIHSAVVNDLEHYDIVDANCHHAVQQGWNAAVIDHVRDRSPAPDNAVVRYHEGFLRWWSGDRDQLEDEDVELSAPEVDHERRLWASTLDMKPEHLSLNTTPEMNTTPKACTGAHCKWAVVANWSVRSLDEVGVRRRRRRQMMAERCRGSKVAADGARGNCPQRGSCDSIPDRGDNSYSSDCEFSKKSRLHFVGFPHPLSIQQSDKDSRGSGDEPVSDSKFNRRLCCGMEFDWSGSIHSRWKMSVSCNGGSCVESKGDMLPMDIHQENINSYNEDSCSQSGSELGHSQAGRSKANDMNICGRGGKLNNAVPATGSDFLCQWTCSGEDGYRFTDTYTSSYRCVDKTEFEITVRAGDNETACIASCEASCKEGCKEKCSQLSSQALDTGGAVCVELEAGFVLELPKKRHTDAGVIILIIACCLCQMCPAFLKLCCGKKQN